MALPKLNETLNFTMTVPSTGKKVKYRPYLVKEEKVLLQAFESGDTRTCLEAMADTIGACVDPKSKLEIESLSTFDVEYMFIKVRSKSVGETSHIQIKCAECGEGNPVAVDLDAIEVEVGASDNVINITDNIAVEMKYPTYGTLIDQGSEVKEDMDTALRLLSMSVAAVLTDEERIDCTKQSQEEIVDFLTSMTATQLQGLSEFMENMPALKHEVEFECEKCQHENKVELKGLSDFF